VNAQRIIAGVVITTVMAAVAAGLMFTGSPARQRLLRLDERRVADLNRLNWAVTSYLQERSELPADLEDLVGRSLDVLPLDPSTGAPYEYAARPPAAFELCAVFSLPSVDTSPNDFWFHDAGRRCFALDAPGPLQNPAIPRSYR
jgi:hypothetical protein